MVTADVVDAYPSIPHHTGLQALRKVLDDMVNKKIYMDDLTKMAKFVLKNNSEFNRKVKKQVLGTAIGTKFSPPYSYICRPN